MVALPTNMKRARKKSNINLRWGLCVSFICDITFSTKFIFLASLSFFFNIDFFMLKLYKKLFRELKKTELKINKRKKSYK